MEILIYNSGITNDRYETKLYSPNFWFTPSKWVPNLIEIRLVISETKRGQACKSSTSRVHSLLPVKTKISLFLQQEEGCVMLSEQI
jgi:hypothetical protein